MSTVMLSPALEASNATPATTDAHVLDAVCFPLWGSRLIEASAGTGKTWTIAALYLRLVLGHGGSNGYSKPLMPPDILVMTFTRAATRELSDRIRQRLVEAVQAFRSAETDDAFLQDLMDAFPLGKARDQAAWRLAMAAECMDDAAIHTIDAWCQRMLREHAFDSGSLFDESLESDESARLREAVQDYWRQQCYPLEGEALEQVLDLWPHVDALAEDVGRLSQEPLPSGAGDGSLEFCALQAQEQHWAVLQGLAQGWEQHAQDLEDWLDGQLAHSKGEWNGSKLQARFYKPWCKVLREWAAQPRADLAGLLKTGATRLVPSGLSEARKGDIAFTPPASSQALEQVLQALDSLPSPTTPMRLHAAARVQERLQWLKGQAGTFGFADMQERLDRALQGEHGQALRQRIRNRYPVALIDEFQDTSPLQYRLFDQVYRTQDNAPDSALLLIGDPKQSIYGFRGADIYSYLMARAATQGRHYVLGTNYRSTPGLVAAVNRWFGYAEQRPGDAAFMFRRWEQGTPHNPLPFEAVTAQGRKECFVANGAPVPALTLNYVQESGNEASPADALQRVLAAQCAEQVVQWLNDPSTGFVQEGASWQRLRPRDMAVLVRTGREAAAVRHELHKRAVASVYLSDRESVFDSSEATDLKYWLQAVAAPLDTRAVRSGLATGLIGLSLNELAWLASDDEAFDHYGALLQSLHGVWVRQGVLAMLRQTLHRLQLPARWLAEMGGERRLTNFLHLAELLQQASAKLEGEQALIRWLAMQLESPASGAEDQVVRLESDEDLVKVVTVHKSKGLEYPVVLVPFGHSFRARERRGTAYLRLPQDDGSSLLQLDFSDEDLVVADKERLREDLRLFYVALTRPRHALWIGWGPMRKGRSTTCVNQRSASGYLIAGDQELSPQGWLDHLQQLMTGDPQVAAHMALKVQPMGDGVTCTRLQTREDPVPLQTSPDYAGNFDRHWGIGSFSALVRALPSSGAALMQVPVQQPADDERALPVDAADTVDATPTQIALPFLGRGAEHGPVWHRFMRGPVVGNFLHDQMEWLAEEDFALQEGGQGALADRLRQRCTRAGRESQAEDVVQWLGAVVRHPLPPLGASLQQLDSTLAEMEFWLPAERLPAAEVDVICREHILPGHERPALPQRSLHGMLMGFADLVFCHEQCYWVLDYKTNHLGREGAAYDEEGLARAMLHHRYDVQAALYMLALHRLLRSRLGASYAPLKHLGGALYYFLRGLDGPAHGVHTVTPSLPLLDALDALMGAGHGDARENAA